MQTLLNNVQPVFKQKNYTRPARNVALFKTTFKDRYNNRNSYDIKMTRTLTF